MLKIAFTGDIAFSKHFTGAFERDFISAEVKNFLKESDHVVANVEGAITEGSITSSRGLNHATPPAAIPTLLECGAKVWSLANNHTVDCGVEGLEDTLRLAKENGCETIGAGMNLEEAAKPVYFEGAGGVGVFSLTYDRDFLTADESTPGCLVNGNTEQIRKNIQEIKSKCRWCIVVCHAGAEFTQLPLPYVRKRFHEFLAMGADFVVGHHPHVVQNYEQVGSKVIFYSLGNFIFDTNYQRNQRYTENGMLVRLNLTEENYAFEAMPIHIDRENQTIVKGEMPAHFKHISPLQYAILWPRACQDYAVNYKSALLLNHPEYKQNPEKFWFDRLKGRHGAGMAWEYYIDPIFAKVLPLWRLGDKDVKGYIPDHKKK